MPTPAEPKKHHYVPEGYLVGFTRRPEELEEEDTEEGKLWRYRLTPRGTIDVKRFHPAGVGYEEKLYTAPRVLTWPAVGAASKSDTSKASDLLSDGEPDAWIETDFFGQIDDKAAKALQTLRAAPPGECPEEPREVLAVFLHSLMERHPRILKQRDTDTHAHLEASLDLDGVAAIEARLGLTPSKRIDVQGLSRQLVRGVMVRTIADQSSFDLFRSFSFTVHEPPAGQAFITSDDPLVVNFGLPTDEQRVCGLSIAVSPVRLLVAADKRLPDHLAAGLSNIHNILVLQRRPLFVFSRWRLPEDVHVQLLEWLRPGP